MSSVDISLLDLRTARATHVRVSAAPVQDEKGAIAGAVAVAINVTKEAELQRLEEQFLRAVAHEIKTPVTIVKGYADMLRSTRDEVSETQRSLLDALVAGADRIDRLVSDLLMLWQLQTGRLALALEEHLDLAEVIDDAVGRLDRNIASRIAVHTSGVLVVEADRQLIEKAVTNLLDNAIRYSPGGEPIDIDAGIADDHAYVAITDRGIGIPSDKRERLFEPFFRAHADTPHDTGGIGLGLYITKAIILLHDGKIDVETEPGRGSTFRFTLPLQHSR